MRQELISGRRRSMRSAWPASLAAALALLALIAVARPTAALGVPAVPAAAALELDEETADEPFADADEDGAEAEVVEEEEMEEEEEDEGAFPPEECLLQTVRSQVFASTAQDKVRLAIHYTSLAPVEVAVNYSLKGKRGSLELGQARGRFGTRGLFQLTAHLNNAEMGRVRAAKSFTVDLGIPTAPPYCRRLYARRLTVKRPAKSQVVWLQSDLTFGSGL